MNIPLFRTYYDRSIFFDYIHYILTFKICKLFFLRGDDNPRPPPE
jgi:hypothetical protein